MVDGEPPGQSIGQGGEPDKCIGEGTQLPNSKTRLPVWVFLLDEGSYRLTDWTTASYTLLEIACKKWSNAGALFQ